MYQILLVQPERIFLTMFACALRNRGYLVFVADNEKAGVECLRHTQPDLVLCSYESEPTNDDLDMVRRMRAINGNVPIIVASPAGLDRVLDFQDAGASLMLSRTLDGKTIAELVEQIAPLVKKAESVEGREIAARGAVSRNQGFIHTASMVSAVSAN